MNNNSISDNWEDVNMTESDSVWDYCVNSSCVPTIDAEVDCIVNMQWIFNICNNNKKRFVPDLFQEKLQPLQSSFIPGDEPFKYSDSQHSKQVAVQKQFYKKGRFSRALTHLLETNKLSSDDDSTATPVTSNNSTIDMFDIEFNIPLKKLKLKVIIPLQYLKSRSDFCDYLFQDETSIPKEITDTIQSLTNNNDLNPLLGSASYTNAINSIEVMNNELGEFNNGDLDIDWYDVVDISAVRLRTDFIREGFSNSDFNHEEDLENNSVVDVNTDTIDIDKIYCIVDIDKIYHIAVIDNKHGEDNKNDLALDWYDIVDVYTVRIRIDLRFNDQETSFLHQSSTTTIKFWLPFLTTDKGTSSNSSIDSNDLSSANLGSASTNEPSCDPNLDLSMHTNSNPGNDSSIVLHPTVVLASLSLSLPVPGISCCIHLAPVLHCSFTLGV